MKKLLFLTVITTVALTACDKNTDPPAPEYTISFGQNEYVGLGTYQNIFTSEEANGDFIIEKAVDEETNKVILAENEGLNINTDMFSAKKINGHNRLQININRNSFEKERNYSLYVKNGDKRGKLTFNQKAYNPDYVGGTVPILFDPIFYDMDQKGGRIETEAVNKEFYIEYIQEKEGQKFTSPESPDTSLLEAEDILTVTVIHIQDVLDPNTTVASKLKIDVKPNNTDKDREIYIGIWNNDLAMRGYLIVFQSAK